MNIEIDDAAIGWLNLSEEQLLFDLAVGLFVNERVSLGKAAEIAGVGVIQFQKELGKRRIPAHYGVEDLHRDLQTLDLVRPH